MKTLIRAMRLMAHAVCLLALSSARAAESGFDASTLEHAPAAVRVADGDGTAPDVSIEREWKDGRCRSFVINRGRSAAKLSEAQIFSVPLPFPPDSRVYGEGFTMLSQTGGTLALPADLGYYTDRDHYKLPEVQGKRTVYGLFTVSPSDGDEHLFGFASCNRFAGQLRFDATSLEAVIDLDGISIGPGEKIELEEFVFLRGDDRNALLREFADGIVAHHPRLRSGPIPTGWCSWYCYGPTVTEENILSNLAVIQAGKLPLRYIQIDDGYQAAMGDWLDVGKGFGGGIDGVMRRIKAEGFEPAIWVAPFVAEKGSRLFQAHPDWFIRDEAGEPLPSDRVTFGGWRRGPWYCLDGSNPEVQTHLENLFREMRSRWSCKYFKLDALYWGAIRGGRFHAPGATRIQAYRLGMQAILRGAGEDSFILGCNHPVWPSLGLIHGSRSSMDVTREWENFRRIAAEGFSRNWQNDRLWFNDPDCVLLTGKLAENEYGYHAAAVMASGGMVLSGDNLAKISPERMTVLRRLLSVHPAAAEFRDPEMTAGRMRLDGRDVWAVFNGGQAPLPMSLPIPADSALTDFWTGEAVETERLASGEARLTPLPPRSARILVVRAK